MQSYQEPQQQEPLYQPPAQHPQPPYQQPEQGYQQPFQSSPLQESRYGQQGYQEQPPYQPMQQAYQEQPSYQPTQQAYQEQPTYQAAQQAYQPAYQQPQQAYGQPYQPFYPPGQPGAPAQVGQKDWLLALLLCLFLGVFGIHRFYTGHIAIGLIQLFTFGLCGIWTLIDLVLIATDNYKDANGLPLRKP